MKINNKTLNREIEIYEFCTTKPKSHIDIKVDSWKTKLAKSKKADK